MDELIHFLRHGVTHTREQFVVCVFDTATGRPRGVIPIDGSGDSLVVAFDPDGQSIWTVELVGPVRARKWAIPTGRPPVWLIVATAAALLFVVADWQRGRRRLANPTQSV